MGCSKVLKAKLNIAASRFLHLLLRVFHFDMMETVKAFKQMQQRFVTKLAMKNDCKAFINQRKNTGSNARLLSRKNSAPMVSAI